MNVLFRSDAGPLEGFESATFRVAINDDGIGTIVGDATTIDAIVGPVVCEIDGTPVFVWTPEEDDRTSTDVDRITLNGRGRTAALERAIVLPVGYPAFTSRTRDETGAPFAIWAALLAEAQGRGRVTDLTPTWTATEDSNGVPWKETIDIQLEPGTTLRSLLDNVTEVEVAEWVARPDGDLDAATFLGVDRSTEVVLFVGSEQIERTRRTSAREQRQTVYIEASTGVSEATNALDPDFGELWLEAQDYADLLSRQALADKLADKLGDPQEEVDVRVAPDCGVFDTFTVGDRIGLDDGSGTIRTVRVVGVTIEVTDTVAVELTLVSEVALRQQRIDRAIEAKADVKLAASPSIQRRHGLVTADKFLSGAVGDDVAIASSNYDPGVDGWAILGNGNAEFNDAIFRGDLQSDNYDPGVAGWALDRDGNAELNDATIRGDLQSDNYVPDVSGWSLERTGFAEFEQGLFRGDIVGGTISIGTDAFNVDATGRLFAGSGTFATAPLRITSDGVLTASGATLTGALLTTGATGARVELRGNRIEFFDQNNNKVAETGSIVSGGRYDLFVSSGAQYLVQGNGALIFIRGDGRIGMSSSGSNFSLDVNTQTIFTPGNVISDGSVQADFIISSGAIVANGNLTAGGDAFFRVTTSGTQYRMNQAGAGSLGGEPTLDTTSDLFGFVGIPSRRIFRGYAGAWLTSSEERLKGEIVDADLARCYDAVREMRLTSYALNRDRDDYYLAKGEWLLGERDEFVDRGGPLRKLGIIVADAPDDVADEEHLNIDLYAYASLIAGAVKALQQRVEAIEDARGDANAG